MKPWLIVAAEARELAGVTKRDNWILLANGPGRDLVNAVLTERRDVEGIVSTGFCGALDPGLRIGDIVVSSPQVQSPKSFTRGEIVTVDRVAATAAEKRALRERTGASGVEMEAAAVEAKAREWGVEFRCVKVVSDEAAEDMPLDFNRYRDAAGRFSRTRIAFAAMARPFSVMPRLMTLDKNCRMAAKSLGEFFADCRF
jgi:adenosylhomocysteine nucleosidase